MRFGFPIPTRGALGTLDNILRLGQAADRYQYDSVWITDHVVIPRPPPPRTLTPPTVVLISEPPSTTWMR